MNESLGGISRLTFQMSVAALPHAKMLRAIELLGTRVAPLVRTALASETAAASLLTNSHALPEIRSFGNNLLASMLREPVLINAEIDESGFQ